MTNSMARVEQTRSDKKDITTYSWDKVVKNGPSKIFGRQPLKKLKEYDLF